MGLTLDAAAAHVGVSRATFEDMVKAGRMPRAKQAFDGERGRRWNRHALDAAFEALPEEGQATGKRNLVDELLEGAA